MGRSRQDGQTISANTRNRSDCRGSGSKARTAIEENSARTGAEITAAAALTTAPAEVTDEGVRGPTDVDLTGDRQPDKTSAGPATSVDSDENKDDKILA